MAMDDNIDTHQQREKDDNKGTQPAKKMKLDKEEISKTQDAANNMKLEEDITKSQGTDTVNIGDPARKVWYNIFLKHNYVTKQRASGKDSMSLFCEVLRDAGCSESLIDPRYLFNFVFSAELIQEEVRKLSDLDYVRGVQPDVFYETATKLGNKT